MGVNPPADIAEVQRLASALYEDLRSSLFGPGHPSTPASVTIEMPGVSTPSPGTGYSASRNWINIQVLDGNLEQDDILDANAWPIWKVDLVEELAHEHQHKVKPLASPTGQDLAKRYGPRCAGPEHDAIFFSSVEALAPILGLEPETLAKRLVGELI